MRALTPYGLTKAQPCLSSFYARRIRDGHSLYEFHLGYQPGAEKAKPRGFWARLFGRT